MPRVNKKDALRYINLRIFISCMKAICDVLMNY